MIRTAAPAAGAGGAPLEWASDGAVRRCVDAFVAVLALADRPAAASKRDRLVRLAREAEQEPALLIQAADLRTESAAAIRTRDDAARARDDADQRLRAVTTAARELDRKIGQIAGEHADAMAIGAGILNDTDEQTASDTHADRSSLAQQARDAVDRWKGSLPDAQLRAQLDQSREHVHELAKRIGNHPDDLVQAAERLVDEHSSRAPADFDADTEQARNLLTELSRRIGSHKEAVRNLTQRHAATRKQYEDQPVRGELAAGERTTDPSTAQTVLDGLPSAEDR